MVLKRMRFFWQNWFDSATVTASSEAADYPAAMLQNRWRDTECGWRSTGANSGGEWIKANLGDAKAVRGFVLENMNLGVGATIMINANPTDDWGGSIAYQKLITITAAMVAERRVVYYFESAPETWKWWLIELFDAGNADGYLSASRIYIGPVFESDDHGSPWTRVRESASEVNYSQGGQASAAIGPKYWVYDLPISILGQADADSFADIDYKCGIDTPLWICRDTTDEIARTVYGLFLAHTPFPSIVREALWETFLKFREEL